MATKLYVVFAVKGETVHLLRAYPYEDDANILCDAVSLAFPNEAVFVEDVFAEDVEVT